MSRRVIPVVPLLVLFLYGPSCGGRDDREVTNGILSGVVIVTAPVAGVVVSAYRFDLETGQQTPDPIATSEPTLEDGRFHLDLGNTYGPLVLVAQGAGSYTEPAAGVNVTWNGTTEIRGLFLYRDAATQAVKFDFELGAEVEDFVLGPFGDLALRYAEARVATGRSPDHEDALRMAHGAFEVHTGLAFWRVAPTSLTDGAGAAWNDAVEAGALVAGLSQLALRMAEDSSITPGGVTSLQLLGMLRSDLSDGVLDGASGGTPLSIGTCATVCDLSGSTLRGHFGEAIANFLGSARNTSGIGVTDAGALIAGIACRWSSGLSDDGNNIDLFPAITGMCSFDTSAPEISIEAADGTPLGGTLQGAFTAEVRVFDAIAMGEVAVGLFRGTDDLSVDDPNIPAMPGEPDDLHYTGLLGMTPTAPDAQTRVVTLLVESDLVFDGGVTLRVTAEDAAGNLASTDLDLVFDNDPVAYFTGVVVLGGRVSGARVTAYEFDGGVTGPALGQSITDDGGYYTIAMPDTTAETVLLVADNAPGMPVASYLEGTNGTLINFSTTDAFESVITDWLNGVDRGDGTISSWTHFATALARAWTTTDAPGAFADRVDAAFEKFDRLLSESGYPVDLRTVQPADLTSTVGTSSLNAQVRYGLMNAALGQLADTHAELSGATPASMNTLTLTRLLARDLIEDNDAVPPLLDGGTGSGPLLHGTIALSSQVTRSDLAVAAAAFLDGSPLNATTFHAADVINLLDHVSTFGPTGAPAELPPPYGDPGEPYDTAPPLVTLTAPTPAAGTVLRGTVSLRAEAIDNRRLAAGAFVWSQPPAVVWTGLDDPPDPAVPWVLTGSLDTEAYPEGPLVIGAEATDEASQSTEATVTVILDRTAPVLAVTTAIDPTGAVVPPGGWTGSATLTITGTVTDPHLVSSTYSWNGGPALPLSPDASGAWTLTVAAAGGSNTLSLSAADAAGNAATALAVYNRDATPPTTTVVSTSMTNESLMSASVSGTGVGTVTYIGGSPVELGTAPVTFAKYASKYAPTDTNLPRWRWNVTDDHSPASGVVLQARLKNSAGTVLVDWSAVATVAGAGYNRQLTLSTGYWPLINVTLGTYTIEYRALDEVGNVSVVGTLTFTQALKAPPVRQRALGVGCDAAGDAQCPSHYGLDGLHDNAGTLILGGAELPSNKVRNGKGVIDNPNAVPVRVNIAATVAVSTQRGHAWRNPAVSTGYPTIWYNSLCAQAIIAPSTCYYPHAAGETINTATFTATPGYQVVDSGTGMALPACTGCFPNEVEIPPMTSVDVHVTTGPFTALKPSTIATVTEIASVGDCAPGACTADHLPVTDVTGALESYFYDCHGDYCNDPPDDHIVREVHFFTRLQWTPTLTVSLQSRPASNTIGLEPAIGTNTASFSYTAFSWSTVETGY